jgi:hypothetical protein
MENLYKKYVNSSVVFIAVVQPWRPSFSRYQNVSITQFLSKYPSSLTYVVDSTEGKVAAMYSVGGWPVFLVLSKTGAIYYRNTGELSSADIGNVQKAIDEALLQS